MKLRSQLLLAGALTGLLPLVAYHSVQQMDSAWRDVRKSDLYSSAVNAGALLTHSGVLTNLAAAPNKVTPRDVFSERVHHSMILDGYADEWAHMQQSARFFPGRLPEHPDDAVTSELAKDDYLNADSLQVKFRSAVTETQLHLFFDVKDDQLVYHNPGVTATVSNYGADYQYSTPTALANGDHVRLYLEANGRINEVIVRPVAPGPLQGLKHEVTTVFEGMTTLVPEVSAFWTVANSGYRLEVFLPVPESEQLFGFTVFDVDKFGDVERKAWAGTSSGADSTKLGVLTFTSETIEELLEKVVPAGSRIRLFSPNGSLQADVNRLYEKSDTPNMLDPASSSIFNALLFRFFEWIITTRRPLMDVPFTMNDAFHLDIESIEHQQNTMATDRPAPVRSYDTMDRDRVFGALLPVKNSVNAELQLLYETNEENANAFTSSAMVRLFSLLTLVSLVVAGSLFAYASWLSWRMRRLSRQAQSAVSGDGRIQQIFSGSSAKDEIGEISRSFATLVQRSAGYTQYLESLASKLSHELRTPLSVVRTSLENIDQNAIDETSRTLLKRAYGGADQLSVLIRSLSEATRLEQSVQRAEYVFFEVDDWLSNAVDSYRAIYPEQPFHLDLQQEIPHRVFAVPDLLQQALDKLIGNAVDFSSPGEKIVVKTRYRENQLELSVTNRGSTIAPSALTRIFEAMYSSRQVTTDQAHLGIGLYIVKLISEAHGGHAFASNVTDPSGVNIGFSVSTKPNH